MSTIKLTLKQEPTVPIEAELLSPDHMAELSHDEVCSTPIYDGKRRRRVDDFFDVEGERSENLELHGDLSRFKWLGREMTGGSLTIHGGAGMHLGGYMKGGRIEVHGDVGDWIGAEMRKGFIHVHGNAGGQIGAAYRGSLSGMRNGTILVDGTAGLEIGMRMRRGTIVIGGPAKDFTGLQMKGGTIILLSGAELRTGAWMNRGTIISLKELPLLPTFAYDCQYTPPFMSIYAKHLQDLGIQLPCAPNAGTYRMYTGDSSVPGKGELLVWQAN